jgi:phage tail sheath protein FI
MAERLHPGVFVEEQARGLAPIQGVSTSNYGTVGFTTKGPTNEAVLVTGFEAFERQFGTFTEDGQMPTHLFAFFANGGARAYVVRVVAADAVSADGFITSDYSEEALATSDGAEKDYTSGGSGPLVLAHLPAEPSSVTISWRTDGTPIAGQTVVPSAAPDGAILDFSFFVLTAGGDPIVPGSVVIDTTITGPATVEYKDGDTGGGFAPSAGDEGQGRLYDVGANLRGYIDYQTGQVTLSVETGNEPDAATTIDVDFTPADTIVTIADDGAGGIPVGTGPILAAPGTIDYATGSIEFTIDAGAAVPTKNLPIEVAYTQRVWDIDPISAGVWGNGVTAQMRGNENFFTRATASYSKYDLLVNLDGALAEVFSEVDADTATDPDFLSTAINDPDLGSDLIQLVEPANEDVAPFTLDGVLRSFLMGGGNGAQLDFGTTDGTGGTPTIPPAFRSLVVADLPIQEGSVSITYVDEAGTARTITDDGAGNLIGDVDGAAPAGFNVINYTTGAFAFRVPSGQAPSEAETSHLAAPTGNVAGSQITAAYYTQPTALITTDALSGGSDGVAGITRNELTDPTLKTAREGMYALLTTDELLNIGIPDAAGDVTMAVDQVAEAETNGKWFIILATTPGLTPQGARDYRRNSLGISSSYAALYYPYIRIADPVTDRGLNIPPIGHVAGVYARTDTTKSVGKTPAGTVDGRLNFSIGLERTLEFAEIDVFFQAQVNAIMDTPQTGRAVWGGRTLENPPGDFRFVHVRRLFNFLKASIFNSTHGFVFENVGAALRSRIQLSVETFLLGLFQQGLFAGTTPSEAFKVICDDTNNPKDVEQRGEVLCDVFVAPNTPGEFIVFRIKQKFTDT